MLPPGHHVSIDGPRLEGGIIRVGITCIDVGITVLSKIDHGQILHLLLIRCRTRKVLLKQRVSLFPGELHAGKDALQPVPFLLKAPGSLSPSNGTVQKSFEHVWMQRLARVRSNEAASTAGNECGDMLDGESSSKQVEITIRVCDVEVLLKIIPAHPYFHPLSGPTSFHSTVHSLHHPTLDCPHLCL